MAHRLLAPGKHVDKIYTAVVTGHVTEQDIAAFENGIDIGEDGESLITEPAKLTVIGYAETLNEFGLDKDVSEQNVNNEYTKVEVTIHEGKYHQIKRMFAALGKEVVYLKRLQWGKLNWMRTWL